MMLKGEDGLLENGRRYLNEDRAVMSSVRMQVCMAFG